jgi:hypothetical protein
VKWKRIVSNIDDVSFFKSKAGFSKLDIYKCPFFKTGGRNIKKTLNSSLRA